MSRRTLLKLRWPLSLLVVSLVIWAIGRYELTPKGLAFMGVAVALGLLWPLALGRRLR
jgi:hypothetical protein